MHLLEADQLASAEQEKQALMARIASLEAALAKPVPAPPQDPMSAVLEKLKFLETRLEEKEKVPEPTKPRAREPVADKPSRVPPVDDSADEQVSAHDEESESEDQGFITTPSGKEVLLIN